jgi:hypothetical protein
MLDLNFNGAGTTKELDEPDAIQSGIATRRLADDYSARTVVGV